jgi:hypothetical protein
MLWEEHIRYLSIGLHGSALSASFPRRKKRALIYLLETNPNTNLCLTIAIFSYTYMSVLLEGAIGICLRILVCSKPNYKLN